MSNIEENLFLEEEEDFDCNDEVTIRAKGVMDGSQTLAEARKTLHEYAECLEELEKQGYELNDPISDDYGFITKR